MRNLSSTAACAFAAAWLLNSSAFQLRAEIGAPAKPPPQPVSLEVEVQRGGSVNIPLRIFGASREQVHFQVRSQPTAGTLSEIETLTSEVSRVVYTHSGIPGESTDTFTYSSKSSAGVSAPARVNIRIRDKPVLLVVPGAIDFPPTIVGQATTHAFTLENRGGGLARGVIVVDTPWQVEDEPRYQLGPGDRASFTLRFHSQRAGNYRATMRYSSDPTRQTELKAEATAPFTAEPAEVKFTQVPGSAAREASVTISNNLDHEIEVEVVGEKFAPQPRKFTLAAGGSQAVSLSISADDVSAISTEIGMRSEDYVSTIRAEAPPPGAVLALEPDELDFGTVDPGDIAKMWVDVSNRGGERAFVEMRVAAPFSVSESDASFTLDPGETRKVSVLLGTDRPGRFRFPATLQTYYGAKELLLAGAVTGPEQPPSAAPSATPLPAGRIQEMPPNPQAYSLPPVRSIELAEMGRTAVKITWPPPAPGNLQYEVQQHVLRLSKNNRVAQEWIPASDTETGTADGRGYAHFHGLKPDTIYRVRIIARAPNGDVSPPSGMIQMHTEATRNFPISLRTILLLTLLAMVALAVFQRRRAREGVETA